MEPISILAFAAAAVIIVAPYSMYVSLIKKRNKRRKHSHQLMFNLKKDMT